MTRPASPPALEIQSDRRPAQIALFRIFLIAAIVGLALRAINITNPLNDWDETTYALVARSLMAGEWPYSTAFDHKPIGLYYLFALFFKAFGYNLTAIRLMPFVAIGVTAWLLFRLVRTQTLRDFHPLGFAAILFMVTCASFGNGGHASNTEIIQMPLFAAWWLVQSSMKPAAWQRPVSLGALTGMAAQINYLGGFVLALSTAGVLLWGLLQKPSLENLRQSFWEGFCALLSFSAVVMLMLLPLAIAGDIAQYFGMQRAYLGVYQGKLTGDKLFRAFWSIAISAAFFTALFVCRVSAEKSVQGVLRPVSTIAGRLIAAMVVTVAAIALTNRLYPHYFNLLLVPSTLLLVVLLGRSSGESLKRFLWLLVPLALIVLSRGAWDVYLKDWRSGFQQRREYAAVTALVKRHVNPHEKLFLFGVNHTVYFLADVVPATRFVFGDHLFMDRFLSTIGSSTEQEIAKALEAKPVLILACFDNKAHLYKQLLEAGLASSHVPIAMPPFAECKDFRGYLAQARVQ